jgi:hypothetical protein
MVGGVSGNVCEVGKYIVEDRDRTGEEVSDGD